MLPTGVVAMAASWPILLIGLFAPRAAAFVLAFVPLPNGIPDSAIRYAWIALAVVVPAIVGAALALKRPAETKSESRLARVARGYPTTVALSGAFWVSFITVPVVHVVTIARRRSDAHVPLVTDAAGYQDAATRIERVLDANGFALVPTRPPAWARAPMWLLRTIGGSAFRDYIPERLAHFSGSKLDVTLHPNSLLLRGDPGSLAYAQGLVVEALTTADAFQTTVPEAQAIERDIRGVWRVLREHPRAHTRSRWAYDRLGDVLVSITKLEAPYDEWQIVYREALQLARALDGKSQLLAQNAEGGTDMEPLGNDADPTQQGPWRQYSTVELMRGVAEKTSALLGKELELARTELRNDFAAEIATVKSLAVAAVALVVTINMLLMAAVFGLIAYMPGWVAALLLAGATLLVAFVAAALGWRHHVAAPLDRTRKTVREDLRWAKEELA